MGDIIQNEILLGVVVVLTCALIYSLLDKKYKAFRMGPLYREIFWQNFIVNAVFVGVVYAIITYIF